MTVPFISISDSPIFKKKIYFFKYLTRRDFLKTTHN